MDPFGLFMFSMAMAILGIFHAIPFTAVHPANNFIERLQGGFRMGYVLGRIGEALDMIAPPRYENNTWYKTRDWSATFPIPTVTTIDDGTETETETETASVSMMTDVLPSRTVVIFSPVAPSETRVHPAVREHAEPGSKLFEAVEARLDEFKTQLAQNLTGTFEVRLNITGDLAPKVLEIVEAHLKVFRAQFVKNIIVASARQTPPPPPRDPFSFSAIPSWMAVLIAISITIFNIKKSQFLRDDVQRFMAATRFSRQEAERMLKHARQSRDDLAQTLNQNRSRILSEVNELDQTFRRECQRHMAHVHTFFEEERQRIQHEIQRFLREEVQPFRTSINTRLTGQLGELQRELDDQEARIRSHVEALQATRLRIPDTDALEAEYENFQEDIRRAQDWTRDFLRRIDEESLSHEQLVDSVKHVEDLLVSIAARQKATEAAAEALQSRQDELETKTKTETLVPEETTQKEIDVKGKDEPPVLKTEEETAASVASADEQVVVGSPLAWRTMAAAASMPQDEWERERQVRRERVLRRETEQEDRRNVYKS